ncbi:MAG: NAD(P)-dependent oxidoreductase [Rhodospirillales bacterium]|nr:NAD(P)-dependent oxidoreductase [Rhodospirillales bacterium]
MFRPREDAITRESPLPHVGVIGIGNMGWPMAACLRRADFPVHAYDSRPGTATRFAAETGGHAAADLAAIAAAADVIVTVLPTSAIVATVADALLPRLRAGQILIDMTSGVPTATRAIAARLAGAGVEMIDAPVSGGVARARIGQLAIMVGGADETIARMRPILDAMGSVTRTGPLGSGQAMKALNNLVSAGGFLIGVEALLIGQRFGLDPDMMVEVLNASSGMNNSTQRKFRQFVLSRRFDSGFGLDLMVKDLSIALQIGRDTATPAPFAAMCRELWAAAAAMLGEGHDHTELARLSERLAGTELSAGDE